MVLNRTIKLAFVFAAVSFAATPAIAQQSGTSDGNSADEPKTDAKPATDSATNVDTVTINPGEPPSESQTDKSKAPSVFRTPSRSGDMRSAPKVSADDVLRQFEQDRPKARPLLPRARPDGRVVREPLADDDIRRSPARLPEGYFLVDRAGRLTREGPWFVFTFTGDNNPTATPDPPMRLLPNRMLERMIRESKGSTTSVEFIVSGEVTDFMGENHLLLRKLLRKRSVGNLSN